MGPRAGLDGCGNPEFDSRTVQPVGSCYTNYAIPSHRIGKLKSHIFKDIPREPLIYVIINPYPTAFPYGNDMVLHFYQQQESSTTKTVHKVINKGLKTYV